MFEPFVTLFFYRALVDPSLKVNFQQRIAYQWIVTLIDTVFTDDTSLM